MAPPKKWVGGEICWVKGCDTPQKYKGLCGKHYKRMWRHKSLYSSHSDNVGKTCKVPGCEEPASKREMCENHYRKWMRSPTHNPLGTRAPNGSGSVNAAGYRVLGRNGLRIYEHILVAEKALGHPLPPGAVVHHVTEDPADNYGPFKLVICPDQAYHLLIHQRMKRKGISFKGD